MPGRLIAKLLLTTAMCGLTACGGGGGGAGSAIASMPPPAPVPAPTPPPPPPPPPPVAVNIFPDITTSTDFAVLGLERSKPTTQLSELTTAGFAVRYDAGSGGYVFTLPNKLPFTFTSGGGSSRVWEGDFGGTIVDVLKPSNPDFALKYVTEASYYTYNFGGPFEPSGLFAFGTATPQSGMPSAGSASYSAMVDGTAEGDYYIRGTASLSFNFGAGTLSGHMDPILGRGSTTFDLGQYDFTNVVYAAGSPTFSGALSHSGTSDLGAFNGQFAGPAAEELMARWKAPFLNPTDNKWYGMFGVWVGKKCC